MFGRSFIHLDDHLFVWTSFGRSFVRLDDLCLFGRRLDDRLDVVWVIVCSFGCHLDDCLFIWTSFGGSFVHSIAKVIETHCIVSKHRLSNRNMSHCFKTSPK